MKKSGLNGGFIAWCGRILPFISAISIVLTCSQGCVQVEQKPASVVAIDSARLALVVDSAAIYRCDTCAFAVAYRRQANGQVKPCKTCGWVTLAVSHNKGDVPEVSNPPVDPLVEQDASQNGTQNLVIPSASTSDSGGIRPPPDESMLARDKRSAKPAKEGDGDGL